MYETFVTIQGNVATALRSGLGRTGSPYASFRLASTVRRPSDQGWQDGATSFYQVSCYRTLAEHAVASLELGQPVVVHGRQTVRQWEKGERSGTDVDIEAYVIGHDLNRGTSLFLKRGRRRPAGEDTAVDGTAESVPEVGTAELPAGVEAAAQGVGVQEAGTRAA